MEDIEIERYEYPKVKIFKSNDEYYGEFNNECEFDRFRIQMVGLDRTNDYYFMFEDIKITIDKLGNCSSWPRGMYDQIQRNLAELFRLRKSKGL